MHQSPVLETNSHSLGLKGKWTGLLEAWKAKGAAKRQPVFSFIPKLLLAH